MADPLILEAQEPHLSAEGKKNLEWLRKKIGAARVHGPRVDPFSDDGEYEVQLIRHDGKGVTLYARSADVVVQRARDHVEYAAKHPRRAAEAT